jgi:hypothetical protein
VTESNDRLSDEDYDRMTGEEAWDAALVLNERLINALGWASGDVDSWWNAEPQTELGGKTATEEWVAGHRSRVRHIVDRLGEFPLTVNTAGGAADQSADSGPVADAAFVGDAHRRRESAVA